MSQPIIGPETTLREIECDAAYELFIDAGVVQPWEIPALRQDPRTLRTVCEIGDLDLEEIVFLIREALKTEAYRAVARAQGVGQDHQDDA
jgi:hypothetical protein